MNLNWLKENLSRIKEDINLDLEYVPMDDREQELLKALNVSISREQLETVRAVFKEAYHWRLDDADFEKDSVWWDVSQIEHDVGDEPED